MQEIADAGILTGTCMMPILPDLCDDDANLENVVRWTAEHGGSSSLAGGLTLSDQQRQFFFRVLAEDFPTCWTATRGSIRPIAMARCAATGGRWRCG